MFLTHLQLPIRQRAISSQASFPEGHLIETNLESKTMGFERYRAMLDQQPRDLRKSILGLVAALTVSIFEVLLSVFLCVGLSVFFDRGTDKCVSSSSFLSSSSSTRSDLPPHILLFTFSSSSANSIFARQNACLLIYHRCPRRL